MIKQKIKINEIFFSIQGESSYAGLPFIFIRLSGCNLRCDYCDTKYAYQDGEELSIDTILQRIERFPSKNVEVTGGEPLMQSGTVALMDTLINNGYRVLLETNGSLDISGVNSGVIRIVDIKCPSSGEHKSFDFKNINHLKSSDEIKFVIASKLDYNYAKRIIFDYNLNKICIVIISGVHKKIPTYKIADWMLRDGLDARLQIQLHKQIWGEKRGK